MAIIGNTGPSSSATDAATAAAEAAESRAVLDAIADLRKRLASVQDLHVDGDDIDTDDYILNTERTS
jgi:hypothetical protein